jgi:two-component system cell cycle response regulator DivK
MAYKMQPTSAETKKRRARWQKGQFWRCAVKKTDPREALLTPATHTRPRAMSARAEAKRAQIQKDERPIRVLVVDDHELTREMYAAYLAHLGMVVYAAADGREAIAKAKSLRPDVVVMDLAMPRLEGDDAAIVLKADPLTRRIPLVAITAYGLMARMKARVAGFDAFVRKPCLPHDLAVVVESLVVRPDRRRSIV